MKRHRRLHPRHLSLAKEAKTDIAPQKHISSDPVNRVLWLLNRAYCRYVHGFTWHQEDPLPQCGPAILVCNHQSSVDPFILSAASSRIIGFLIAREYYEKKVMAPLFRRMGCIPVNRNQKYVCAIRKALRALKLGHVICIFPEGGISRGLNDSKQGVGYLSLKSGAPVIPAYVCGTPSSDSVYRALRMPSRSRVIFGPSCQPSSCRDRKPTREEITAWTETIMSAISTLSE